MEYRWTISGIVFLLLDLVHGFPIQPYPAVAVPTYTITGEGGYEISTSSGQGGYGPSGNSVEESRNQGEPYGVQQQWSTGGITSGAGTPQVFNFYNSYPVFNYQSCCSSSGCPKPMDASLALPENFTDPEYAAYLPVPAPAPDESYPPEPVDTYLPQPPATYPPVPLPPGLYAQPQKDHLSGLIFPLPHEEAADLNTLVKRHSPAAKENVTCSKSKVN